MKRRRYRSNSANPPRRPTLPDQPAKPTVRVPLPATLRKYGLSPQEWITILEEQGNVCAVCRKVPDSGKLVTDHEHVAGWKKMPPEERKRYVRGILCYWCNHNYVGRRITATKAANILSYLKKYERRQRKWFKKKGPP